MDGAGIYTVILGGSDRRTVELPPTGRGKHPLVGYKGMDIRIGGRRMVELLIERLGSCPELDPIVIAGPSRIYGDLGGGVPVIDTDSSFGDNVRAAVDAARSRAGAQEGDGGQRMAFFACDVLPDPDELRGLLDDLAATGPCDLWFPLIEVPGDPQRLGEFGWKPHYRIVPAPGEAARSVLPGHLMVADPRALRLGFVYDLLEVAYRTRNRPIATRRISMAGRLLLRLLYRDLLAVLRLRAPSLTFTVFAQGLRVARKLETGTLTRGELESAVSKIVVKNRHRRRFPGRGARLPILPGLTLAEDIDTLEEAREVERARSEPPV